MTVHAPYYNIARLPCATTTPVPEFITITTTSTINTHHGINLKRSHQGSHNTALSPPPSPPPLHLLQTRGKAMCERKYQAEK
ncbi:hypothetical protein O3P69_007101 [Scylla paramamosain]|uniref:Uncharacterized protein n=1 Tax=Scylla paramamosain TaxID=85552 RepID=A0AAW0V2C4_SCYPA